MKKANSKREDGLMKNDISRYKNKMRMEIQELVAFLLKRVFKKHTRFGSRSKLIAVSRKGRSIAKASKNSNMIKRRFSMKQFIRIRI
jgi:hypothetical protein